MGFGYVPEIGKTVGQRSPDEAAVGRDIQGEEEHGAGIQKDEPDSDEI